MIGEKVKYCRLARGWTQAELAERMGYGNKSTIARIENDLNDLPLSKVEKLAKVLGVSPSYLMGWTDNIEPTAKKIPILGTICAGNGIFCEENFDGTFQIDNSVKADFGVRVRGDSMTGAGIYDGDLALIRKDFEFKNGEIYAILFNSNSEASLKKVYRQENGYALLPCNDDYPPIFSSADDCLILGELEGVYHSKK